ncbi:MAG TPA: ribosomal protein S18-alanine N-acetyltransferase [Microbacteriaceae bacterium]|nr:ribosomal protein S18-alanine N-acetyltransferase [Microbacteriaceae bacterium]
MIRNEKASINHIAQISELEKQLFGNTAWSEETIEAEITGDHRSYWVLLDNSDMVIGYAGVLLLAGDADIQTIAVSATHQGFGYGRDLLKQLLYEARKKNTKNVFLEVRADNQAAIQLYENEGFKNIGVRKGYYQPDGVDAIIMQLDLAKQAKEIE